MSYELFRQINTVVPVMALGFLMWRVSRSWAADWAKPDHVTHYRTLLALVGTACAIVSAGSTYHESLHSQATWVSPAWTCFSVGVLALCACWPKPRALAR